jgi:hypothetical protein
MIVNALGRMTMTVTERRNILSSLPIESCIAFAAICSERAVTEAERVCPEKVGKYPALRDATNLLWRQAISKDLDYEKDFKPLLEEFSDLLPDSDEGPVIDQVLINVAGTVSLGVGIVASPETSGRLAVSAGNTMVMVVANAYEDRGKLQSEERKWQDQAVQLLANYGNRPITKTMFNSIPEYERGPISEEYLNADDD